MTTPLIKYLTTGELSPEPRYVTPPEQLERALRDLLRGWQEVVFAEPSTTDDYRALTQQVILDTEASFREGATAYEVVIFTLAPVFAAADEETVEVVMRPDDAAESHQSEPDGQVLS